MFKQAQWSEICVFGIHKCTSIQLEWWVLSAPHSPIWKLPNDCITLFNWPLWVTLSESVYQWLIVYMCKDESWEVYKFFMNCYPHMYWQWCSPWVVSALQASWNWVWRYDADILPRLSVQVLILHIPLLLMPFPADGTPYSCTWYPTLKILLHIYTLLSVCLSLCMYCT